MSAAVTAPAAAPPSAPHLDEPPAGTAAALRDRFLWLLVKDADADAILAFELTPAEKARLRQLRDAKPAPRAWGAAPSDDESELHVGETLDREAAMLKAAVQRRESGWTGPSRRASMPSAPDADEFPPTGPAEPLPKRDGLRAAHDRFLALAVDGADHAEVATFLMTEAESRREKRLWALTDRHLEDPEERAELEEFEAVGRFCSFLKAEVILRQRATG